MFGIVGAGGMGRDSIAVAKRTLSEQYEPQTFRLVFVDKRADVQVVNGYQVLSDEAFLGADAQRHFNVAIADCATRRAIVERYLNAGARLFSVIASSATILDQNVIGEGALLSPYTTVTSNVRIGKCFHSYLYSFVAHDCVIGDFVTFAGGVQCNGGVTIEDDVYVGSGVIIRQSTEQRKMVIGRGATLGMGAVVTQSVAPYTTVVGNPARPIARAITS